MARIAHEDRDSFVGRKTELAEILRRAGSNDRFSITGPPGSGKSRLAREAARRGEGLFLEINETDDDAAATLTHALDIALAPQVGETERRELIRSSLSGYPIVLIEGPVDVVSEFAGESTTLVRCDGVELDDSLELQPLEPHEALELLVDRARERDRRFEVNDASRGAIESLLAEADHWPRAIERLARELTVFAPEELLELRRDNAFGSAQRAEWGDWERTFERLDDLQTRALAAATYLPAGFGVRSLAAILGVPISSTARAVEVLVEHRLIRRVDARGSSRANFVIDASAREEFTAQDSVRVEGLSEGVVHASASRAQHALCRYARDEADDEFAAIRHDEPNLFRAVEIARDSHPAEAAWIILALVEASKGRWSSAREASWLEVAAVVSEGSSDAELQAAGRFVKGQSAFRYRKYEQAIESFEWVRLEDEYRGPIYWASLTRLADSLRMIHRYDEAIEFHRRVVDEVPTDFQACLARAHIGVGWYYSVDLDYERLREEFSRAVALANEIGSERISTTARRGQIDASMVRGDFETARIHAQAIVDELENDTALQSASSRLMLADILIQANRIDEARHALDEAGEVYRSAEFSRMRGYHEFGYAKLDLLAGELDAALERITAARDWFAEDPAAFLLDIVEEFIRVNQNTDSIRLQRHDEWVQMAEDYWEAAAVSTKLFMLASRMAADCARPEDPELLDSILQRAEQNGMLAHVSAARILKGEDVTPLGFDACLFAKTLGRESGRILRVGPDGHWFEVEGRARVEIGNRKALPALLLTLARNKGGAVDSHDLAEAGWPGEKLHPDTATNRVYVAVHALRKLGLAEYLTTQGRGYTLHPDVKIEFVN